VFADNIGHARHLVVAPNGVVYVNTWSGRYYGNDTPPPGGFLVALQDNDGDGQADATIRFGDTFAKGAHGGTGIALHNGHLYAEVNDRIVRYALPDEGIAPTGSPETIVSGLPLTGDHPMHPFAIDARGGLYVNSGSATNACQVENRIARSPGHQPCTELETRAGIWRYDANRTGQQFSPAERFATGIRNAVGIAVDASGLGLYATQHGRDQLHENWPSLYTQEQGSNLPAEELLRLEQGADYGWPECYFDDTQNKLVLAPEYGGDGGKKVGICADKKPPIAVFPAHWAPNALLLYDGAQFPAAYRGGAFIAFHGSWNRAPLPQGGYNVVFQPLGRWQARRQVPGLRRWLRRRGEGSG
jgi:glucose/arabinose dehydrogenase